MLRIYLHSTNGGEWLSLEGALAGNCVDDLERCWLALARSPLQGKSLLVDMTHLQSADQNGQKLLARMRSRGVTLAGLRTDNGATEWSFLDLCLRWIRRGEFTSRSRGCRGRSFLSD
jgi:hypothetical protein